MKLFTGWVLAAGLVLAAAAAQAQVRRRRGRSPVIHAGVRRWAVPIRAGPYAAMPPEAPRPGYGNGPTLLPPTEVYTVVRESGFSPLGIPHQRGFVYTIAVIDRSGDDGRLVIDARNGRILRFVPAHGMGDNFNDDAGRQSTARRERCRRRPMSGARRGRRGRSRMSRAAPCRCRRPSPLAAKPAPEQRAADTGAASNRRRRRNQRQPNRNRLKRRRRRPPARPSPSRRRRSRRPRTCRRCRGWIDRHCERSEAIHAAERRIDGLLRRKSSSQ